jgi:hypothetical protein
MHDDDDPEIEYSPLCEEVTREGITVRVQIYRLKIGDPGWSLEVIDQENASTVWDDLFATDHEALAEFYRTLEDEGIQSLLMDRRRLHWLIPPHLVVFNNSSLIRLIEELSIVPLKNHLVYRDIGAVAAFVVQCFFGTSILYKSKWEGPAVNRALLSLFLLLALWVGLITMLVGGLWMLLCTGGVFLALGMVALAMMFSGGTMCLGSVFVVFGCLVVFVSCHFKPR